MNLPLKIPIVPMAPKEAEVLPVGPQWNYEQKWDGFRCVAFKDGDQVILQSRSGNNLTEKFPELTDAFHELRVPYLGLDGEVIIFRDGKPSFPDLLRRNSASERTIASLVREAPAGFVAFDMLVGESNEELFAERFEERRKRLEHFREEFVRNPARLGITESSGDVVQGREWLSTTGVATDGVVAKHRDGRYVFGPTNRVLKVKPIRTMECVVGGIGLDSSQLVTTFYLGVYDDAGRLDYVGSIPVPADLLTVDGTNLLLGLKGEPGFTGKSPDSKNTSWLSCLPVFVIEVSFRHFGGGRLGDMKFKTFRSDKSPAECDWTQIYYQEPSST